MNYRAVALIGFMGCGKTTIGRMVANELDYPFSDLDDETQRIGKMRMTELFEAHGELGVRRMETLALSRLSVGGGIVSTSGSCIMYPANRRILEESFITFYLRAGFYDIYPRIIGTGRTMLTTLTQNELEKLYSLREPLYMQTADFVLDARESPERITSRILDILLR